MSTVQFHTHEPPRGGLSQLRQRLRQPRSAPPERGYQPVLAAALLLVGVVLVAQIPPGPEPAAVAPLPGAGHPLLRAAGVAGAGGEAGEKTLMVRTENVRAYWLAPPTPPVPDAR